MAEKPPLRRLTDGADTRKAIRRLMIEEQIALPGQDYTKALPAGTTRSYPTGRQVKGLVTPYQRPYGTVTYDAGAPLAKATQFSPVPPARVKRWYDQGHRELAAATVVGAYYATSGPYSTAYAPFTPVSHCFWFEGSVLKWRGTTGLVATGTVMDVVDSTLLDFATLDSVRTVEPHITVQSTEVVGNDAAFDITRTLAAPTSTALATTAVTLRLVGTVAAGVVTLTTATVTHTDAGATTHFPSPRALAPTWETTRNAQGVITGATITVDEDLPFLWMYPGAPTRVYDRGGSGESAVTVGVDMTALRSVSRFLRPDQAAVGVVFHTPSLSPLQLYARFVCMDGAYTDVFFRDYPSPTETGLAGYSTGTGAHVPTALTAENPTGDGTSVEDIDVVQASVTNGETFEGNFDRGRYDPAPDPSDPDIWVTTVPYPTQGWDYFRCTVAATLPASTHGGFSTTVALSNWSTTSATPREHTQTTTYGGATVGRTVATSGTLPLVARAWAALVSAYVGATNTFLTVDASVVSAERHVVSDVVQLTDVLGNPSPVGVVYTYDGLIVRYSAPRVGVKDYFMSTAPGLTGSGEFGVNRLYTKANYVLPAAGQIPDERAADTAYIALLDNIDARTGLTNGQKYTALAAEYLRPYTILSGEATESIVAAIRNNGPAVIFEEV